MADTQKETQKKKKTRGRWVLPRHRIVRAIFGPLIGLYTRLAYHIDIRPFTEQGGRQYLVLFNHQTAFDQFFVMMGIKGPVYYIASEDIFTNGLVSKLISWLVAPIPIKKQMTDVRAVKACIQVAREGGTIALAPEGNRTFSGRTVYINPAIVKLIKLLKLPIAVFLIENGYGVQPRWSDVTRHGRMTAGVTKVIEPEEYLPLSNEALYELLIRELSVDENQNKGSFRHAKTAEYMERMVYVCPACGLSSFESEGRRIRCRRCGLTVTYGDDKTLSGEGYALPFRFAGEWYDYQERFINALDLLQYTKEPLYEDSVSIWKVKPYKRKILLKKEASALLYGDRIELKEGDEIIRVLPFADCDVLTVLGRNKLNIYSGDDVLQLKSGKRFNALKYMNFYHRCRNIMGGTEDDKFLGL